MRAILMTVLTAAGVGILGATANAALLNGAAVVSETEPLLVNARFETKVRRLGPDYQVKRRTVAVCIKWKYDFKTKTRTCMLSYWR